MPEGAIPVIALDVSAEYVGGDVFPSRLKRPVSPSTSASGADRAADRLMTFAGSASVWVPLTWNTGCASHAGARRRPTRRWGARRCRQLSTMAAEKVLTDAAGGWCDR